jgi:tRNA (cmo5U34)-methyltransferase
MSEKDRLYQDKGIQADHFVFDARVVRVFPDMIRRSVPGYGLIIPSIALLARRHAQNGTRVYDLGCSLGAASFAMLDALAGRDCEIVAVDSSPEMVARLKTLLEERQGEAEAGSPPLRVLEADVLATPIENASVVVLNFTLQFIDREARAGLLRRICEGMRPGGILVLSEKLQFEDESENSHQDAWHLDFKRAQGYSELEIARKRDALDATLLPDSMEAHLERLRGAGFREAWRWFQCFNFASIVAIR